MDREQEHRAELTAMVAEARGVELTVTTAAEDTKDALVSRHREARDPHAENE